MYCYPNPILLVHFTSTIHFTSKTIGPFHKHNQIIQVYKNAHL